MKAASLSARLDRMPMVKAVAPFAAGILAADCFTLPLWFLAGAFLLSGTLALLLHSQSGALVMLLTAGFAASQLRDTAHTLPRGIYTTYELTVEGIPAERGRYTSAEATAVAWRDPSDGTWHASGDRIMLYADSLTALYPGERIRCRGSVRPFRGGAESYRRLMARRGFAGTLWLSERTLIERLPGRSSALHLHAVERMQRIGMRDDAGAVCRAMVTGDRSGITQELRTVYSRSGLSHLLAVSGLHTGIVFALVNLMLWWLPLLHRGHLVRNLLATVCIWLFVAAAGFSPSAVRAAVMCTMLQFALASASEYVALNALAAAGFGMLLWNPAWLGDISFQLSFIAVAAILAWGVPLCRLLHTRRRALNLLTDALVISLVAGIATAPRIAHLRHSPAGGTARQSRGDPRGKYRRTGRHRLDDPSRKLARPGLRRRAFGHGRPAQHAGPSCRGAPGRICRIHPRRRGDGGHLPVFSAHHPGCMVFRAEKKRTFAGMITPGEYTLLLTDEVQRAIAANRGRDPLEVALDRNTPHARLVATQVKYLARAEAKLPSYAAAQCILPPLAFEQASSEACAAHKRIAGGAVLDLTCGLGADAFFLARRFRRVVTLERDQTLARIAAENFRRLGATNIEVVNTSAEAYLAQPGLHFDWVYADPDRRSGDGRKLVRLEDCSPDILSLMPLIGRTSGRLCVKNSPLFDIGEALRLFPGARVEAVSLGDECKEVVIYADGTGPGITATALGRGSFTATPAQAGAPPHPGAFEPDRYRWLVVPDVALQKARLARLHLRGKADIWSENGYGFATERPEGIIGKVFAIERIEPYDPRRLKRAFKGRGAELMKRDFPFAAEELGRRLGVHAGNDVRLAFTKIGSGFWVVRLE